MQLRVFQSQADLINGTAELLLQSARENTLQKGRFNIALSGGNTPRSLYEFLAADPRSRILASPQIHYFWSDERTVPADHADSNYFQAHQLLLKPLQIPPENIHRVKTELDPISAAEDYRAEILDHFQEPHPSFDLIMLGVGDDGHTASLFPGSDVVKHPDKYHWVAANQVSQLNTWRITFTPRLINQAEKILILASGVNKARILPALLEGPYLPEKYPAQLIKHPQGNLVWLMDSAAASGLKSRLSPDNGQSEPN